MDVTFPYIQSSRNLIDLSIALRKTMPPKITLDYIKFACAISEASAQKVLADLKKFELVNDEGAITERGRMLRSPEKYGELGTQILDQYFSTFKTMLELHPDTWSEHLESYLVEKTNLGDSARAKLRTTIGFFWTLAQGINVLEQKKNDTNTLNAKQIPKQKSSPSRIKNPQEELPTSNVPQTAVQQVTVSMESSVDQSDFKYALLHKFTLWLASDLNREPEEIKDKWIALRQTLDLL